MEVRRTPGESPSSRPPFPGPELTDLLEGTRRARFISDVHLSATIGPRHLAFRDFLADLSRMDEPPTLFILGDLFDTWIGSRARLEPGHRLALLSIERAAREGLRVFFLEGNRDFLLGPEIGREFGFVVLPPRLTLELGGQRVCLTHGDELLLRDRGHQRLRWLLRSGITRALAETLSEALIERIAQFLRRNSRGNPSGPRRHPPRERLDFSPEEVARLARAGVEVVICGHLHREEQREVLDGERPCRVFSLGAWEERASVLVFDGETLSFEHFPLDR